jgi:hypothetical protein
MKDILKKFKFKADPVVIAAPAELQKAFAQLGFASTLDKKIKSSNTLVFVNSKKELVHFLGKQLKMIEPDSVLWFAYPKLSSGIVTDIHRDIVHAVAEEFGVTPVTAVSINETWSALRVRPIHRVGK